MSLSVVKEAKTKNRIQANLALWSEAGRATGVGQADNLELQILAYLQTSCVYVTPRNRGGGEVTQEGEED